MITAIVASQTWPRLAVTAAILIVPFCLATQLLTWSMWGFRAHGSHPARLLAAGLLGSIYAVVIIWISQALGNRRRRRRGAEPNP